MNEKEQNTKKFLMAILSVWQIDRVMRRPNTAEVISQITDGYANALRMAMDGKAIYAPKPANDLYQYHRNKWIETGRIEHLECMIARTTLES